MSDSAQTQGEWPRPRGLVALAFLTLPIATLPYSFAFLSFNHPKSLALAGCLVVALAIAVLRPASRPGGNVFWPLWALLAYALVVQVLFSFAPVGSFVVEGALILAVPLAFATWAAPLLQTPRTRALFRTTWLATALIVALLGIAQFFNLLPSLFPDFPEYGQRVYSVFGNQNLYGAFLAAAVPLAIHNAFTARRFGQALVVFAVVVAALTLSASRGAMLAALLGALAVLPACPKAPRRLAFLSVAALSLAVGGLVYSGNAHEFLTVPWRGGEGGDRTGQLRLWFWDGALRMAVAHPLVGAGLGNFAYASPAFLGAALRGRFGAYHTGNDIHTQHAHCDPLELLAETGLVGAALLAAFLWQLRRGRGPEWGPFVALSAYACLNPMLPSTPHALWWLMSAAALIPRPKTNALPPISSRPRAVAAFTGALCLLSAVAVVETIPSVLRTRLQERANHGLPTESACESIRRYPWPMPYALEECGYLAWDRNDEAAALAQFESAAARLDTWTIHAERGMLYEAKGDTGSARAEYNAALYRWPRMLPVYQRLVGLTPSDERAALVSEARRWFPSADVNALFGGLENGLENPGDLQPQGDPPTAANVVERQ